MRVVVTGATGNIGTALRRAIGSDPAIDEIIGIARRPPDRVTDRTRWVAADLFRDDLAPLLDGADAVVHLAWTFQPTRDPVATWENNVVGAERVFRTAGEVGVGALLYTSSVGAYRPHPGPERVDEQWPVGALPTAAYGREKSYLEPVLDAVAARFRDLRVVRVRPAFVFQRDAASEQRRLFAGPFLPTAALRIRPPLVPVPAGIRFQALHADDVAEALRCALHTPVEGAFNLAAEPVIGPAELAHALGGRPVEVPLGAVRAAVAAAWHARLIPASPQLVDLVSTIPLLDAGRARRELGWSPRVSATEALGDLLDGLRHGASGPTPTLAQDRPLRSDELASGVGSRPSP
jgi:UDP-glucose 4-epimerase